MPSILFVCTGNIHRSPIAEAAFKKKLKDSRFSGNQFIVHSAGTWTRDGMRIGKRTTMFAQHNSLDVQGHRSRSVNQNLLESSDLVLVMERGQLEALTYEFSENKSHIYLLTGVSGNPGYDIPDPIRVGGDEHAQILQEIMDIIDDAFEAICTLATRLYNKE